MMYRVRLVAAAAGFTCLAVIVFATLSPIDWRPSTGEPADLERFLAFFALAALFLVAWPRRRVLILILVVASAGALEAAQNLRADRHGRSADFFSVADRAGVVGLLLVGAVPDGTLGKRSCASARSPRVGRACFG